MTGNEAATRLAACEQQLRSLGVEHLFLFGSTARGTARASSDVDLFVDYTKGRFGLYELMDVQALATRALQRPADVTTRDGLHPDLRPAIVASARKIF